MSNSKKSNKANKNTNSTNEVASLATMLNNGAKINWPKGTTALRITEGDKIAVVNKKDANILKGAVGANAVVEFGTGNKAKFAPLAVETKANKATPKAKKSESKRDDVLGLSVCGFCRAAGRSGLTLDAVLAVLAHFKASHGGKTAANQRRWGVKGTDRQGQKIEALSAEQLATIKPIIAAIKPVAKAPKVPKAHKGTAAAKAA